MKPGNKKGTNPRPPDRTRGTRRTAIVLRTPPPVLNSTAVHCGPPFGTKRPQVQILSPRPVFPQVIPEGGGPCQGLGDHRFGLSSTAAHTSTWATGQGSGGARPRSGRRALSRRLGRRTIWAVSYTHLRANETVLDLVC